MKGKNVVLGITGSIAAYKAAELASLLKKRGVNVDVIMTKSAMEFINPLTFEVLTANKVVRDMFERTYVYNVEHITLAQKADLFVVAPASANIIGKLANGIADDMLSTTLMATKSKILIAPAMNTNMYENPAVVKNIQTLKDRNISFIEPKTGVLACGDTGKGKLANVSEIFQAIEFFLTKKDLLGKNILVTAGATREALDPVRFISNNSTGKMGYEIAKAASLRGANVCLVSGKTNLETPFGVNKISITSALEMYDAVLKNAENQDIIIKAAAVGDYKPSEVSENKIKKKTDDLSIKLVKNPDILKKLGEIKRENQFLCGFSMETQDLIKNSQAKLEAKNCDMLVANNLNVEGAGFAVDTNVVTLLYKNGKKEELNLMSKSDVANTLLNKILEQMN